MGVYDRALLPSGVQDVMNASSQGTAWTAGATGVGFDLGVGYQPPIGLDLQSTRSGVNRSAFVRRPEGHTSEPQSP